MYSPSMALTAGNDAAQHLGRSLCELQTAGFVALRQLAAPAQIEQIATELEPWFETTPTCRGDFYGWHTTRVNAVLYKSRTTHALALHPLIKQLAHEVLGDHCD